MFETFRSIRFHLLLAALGYIAVGAVMLFIPDQFLAVVCYVIGALLFYKTSSRMMSIIL